MQRVFQDNHDKHLKRSGAFLSEAVARCSDDLLFRSALGDSVEVIKHSFQAYLWKRAGEVAADDRRQRWQLVANEAKMPDLIPAVREAGLDIDEATREKIVTYNSLRNHLTHDSPLGGTRISPQTASDALALAQDIRNKVVVAFGGQPVIVWPPKAASASRKLPPPPPPPPGPIPTPPPSGQGKAQPEGNPKPPEPPLPDPKPKPPGAIAKTTRRPRTGWLIALAAVLALLAGLAGGVALGYPLGQGHVPTWLPAGLLPANATPTSAASATATPVTPTGPFVIGTLLITPSACGVAPATLMLTDTGGTAVNWSAGSPDSAGAAFTILPNTLARPTISGRLIPGASVTLLITGIAPGTGHVVVVTDGGALALPVGAC